MTDLQKTVLIVDNDEDWLNLLERLLGAEGYAVIKAGTCAQAIALAAERVPHCVMADLHLDCEDGMAVCCHIKNSPRLRHIPVVMLSGGEPPPESCACKCDAFVCKSDGSALLLKTLKKVLA